MTTNLSLVMGEIKDIDKLINKWNSIFFYNKVVKINKIL